MNLNEISNNSPDSLIEIITSDDSMIGYVKLTKPDEEAEPITKEAIMEALATKGIVYGIKEGSIEKLVSRPIYNIKIEVARGLDSVYGEDGQVIYHVKKDSEYKPEYDIEGTVDYKNLDYFQLVKAGQLLAEILPEKEGTEGTNLFGNALPTRSGRPAPSPYGKNTEFVEDGKKLIASCDGVVRFLKDAIDINDMFKVPGNVNQLTGNINFSGDVTVEGDVCDGFTVKTGGNLIVKGVVEGALIEATGDVHISKGINGGGKESIHVGGDLKCKYIENAIIHVEGNVSADYIIDSQVTCMGNIELMGSRELVVGGDIKVMGELHAKSIGTASERPTKIEVLGIKVIDQDTIDILRKEIDENEHYLQTLMETAGKVAKQLRPGASSELEDQLSAIRKQILVLKGRIDHNMAEIKRLENDWTMEYYGAILCKRKLYQGVKISFGQEVFRFNLDDIEHCRIYWHNGEIIQGTL